MSDFASDMGWTTGGLYLGPGASSVQAESSTLCTQMPVVFGLTGALNPREIPASSFLQAQTMRATSQAGVDYSQLSPVRDPYGHVMVPGVNQTLSLGGDTSMTFDPGSTLGRITPALDPLVHSVSQDGNFHTYSGSDIKVMITATNGSQTILRQLAELHSFTISVHREKYPARALGYINPKGFGRGTRTIAGTMILTPANVDVLMPFLQPGMIVNQSKDTVYSKVDQLPPFDMTLFFSNENGYASHREVLGVEFVTDGEIYSVNDMMVERTISYVALDFTPLLPVSISSLFHSPSKTDPRLLAEKSPTDLFSTYAATPAGYS